MSFDRAKFRRPVVPGDQLHLHSTILRGHGKVWKSVGEARVDGRWLARRSIWRRCSHARRTGQKPRSRGRTTGREGRALSNTPSCPSCRSFCPLSSAAVAVRANLCTVPRTRVPPSRWWQQRTAPIVFPGRGPSFIDEHEPDDDRDHASRSTSARASLGPWHRPPPWGRARGRRLVLLPGAGPGAGCGSGAQLVHVELVPGAGLDAMLESMTVRASASPCSMTTARARPSRATSACGSGRRSTCACAPRPGHRPPCCRCPPRRAGRDELSAAWSGSPRPRRQ